VRLDFPHGAGEVGHVRCLGPGPEPIGRLAFGIFAALAEFERELIAERTKVGLAAARARGRMGGGPRKMDRATLTMAMAAMRDPRSSAAEVARTPGMTTTTLYAYVNGDGSPKAAGTAVLAAPSLEPVSG
jgi:DNA invertase Pin-like site-specific DNA recombinase